MGQRQDKDEIVYGDDCVGCFPAGKTPKYVYVRLSLVEKCPDPRLVPPNDRVFKLTQDAYNPCDWFYQGSTWRVEFQCAPDPAFVWLSVMDPETGVAYFEETPAGLPDESHTYHNRTPACDDFHGATGGTATVTWQLETIKILKLLNMKGMSDIFMEMRPLVDGNRVYKFCRLQDATNIAIEYEPEKVYEVTGTLTPDVTGYYFEHIMHNGKRSYRRTDGLYFLWWDGATRWVINTGLDIMFPPAWLRVDPNPIGDYQPIGPWTGVATFAEI